MLSKLSNQVGPTSNTFKKRSSTLGGQLRLLILGDASTSTVRTLINNRLVALGYSGFTISTTRLSTTYSGSDLNVASYSTILMYTNGSDYGSSTLPTNLNSYMDNGGNFVTAVFMWNIKPTGFDYDRTAFQANPIGQSSRTAGATMSIDVPHIITTGISLSIGASFENTTTTMTTGATKLATSSTGRPLIGIKDNVTYRIASFNSFPPQMDAVQTQLLTNCILWANGNIT